MFKKIAKLIGDEYNPFTQRYENVYSLEKTETVYVAPKVHEKKLVFYNKKAIISNNVIEIVEYKENVCEGFKVTNARGGKKKGTSTKRSNNINQSKMSLRRLINANVTGKDLFITLTYKENMCSIEDGKKDFKKFIMRWNYRRKKEGLDALKYVYVVEFQKRGAVHFHCIFFNVGYIANKSLNALWGKGFVKVNKIDKVDNIGSYVVKYMEKDLIDDRLNGKDLYGRSKGNLKEPVTTKNPQEVAVLERFLANNLVYCNTYDSEYYGQITYKQYNLYRNGCQDMCKGVGFPTDVGGTPCHIDTGM